MSSSLTHPPDPLTHKRPHSPPELFGQDQLERHALALAELYRVAPDPAARSQPLLPRLDDAAKELDDAYRFLTGAITKDAPAVGSEDWLRDNYHVVQDQVREIRQDLPRKYYLELPKLAGRSVRGLSARLHDRARADRAHGRPARSRDARGLRRRVSTRRAALDRRNWAMPIMLRLALVEELRRLADGVVSARRSRGQARRWVALLGGRRPRAGTTIIDELLRDGSCRRTDDCRRPSSSNCCSGCAISRPRRRPAWQALQRALQAQGDSPEEMLRIEHQREAADQLAIGNVITSMRLLSSIDWPLFFDRVGLVEQVLREDPAGAYARDGFSDARPLPPFRRAAGEGREACRR